MGESIQCWQCGTRMTLDELASNDGDCPRCEVEVHLAEYLDNALSKVATLEAENAKLRAELERLPVDGWKLVPVEPTPEMVSAAEEAYMPFGDMDIALRMAILAAPSAPKADERLLYTCIGKGGEYRYLGTAIGAGDSRGELVEVYQDENGQLYHRTPEDFMERMEPVAAAIAAARQEGKV